MSKFVTLALMMTTLNPYLFKSTHFEVIYCPPDSIFDTFRGKLEDRLLHRLNKLNKDCIILGDLNIDISKDDGAKHDFINTFNTFIRVIDNFITNIWKARLGTRVVQSDIPMAFFMAQPHCSRSHILKLKKSKS